MLHEYPNTNFHELNLDYILKQVSEIDAKVKAGVEKAIHEIVIEALYDEATETITLAPLNIEV